jgi:transcriptional regulator with XRE-family HTH domain
MEDLRKIIGNNLAELRKRRGLTQFELAEKFNYTDRAVSKWENGDTLPDVEILHNLCEFYGVTLDYLTHEENNYYKKRNNELQLWNKIVISALVLMIVWGLATIIFVVSLLRKHTPLWQSFVVAVPVSAVVVLYLNRIYFKNKMTRVVTWTVFVWGLLASAYLIILDPEFWPLFLLGVPAQASIILYFLVMRPKKPENK